MSVALVIEDDREVRNLMRETLEDVTTRVIEAENAPVNFDELKRYNPDIIFLDLTLPQVQGIDFLKMLRKDKSFDSVPVVVVTGETGHDEQLEAFEAGADDYVVKPFFPKTLVARTKAILRRTVIPKDQQTTYIRGPLKVDFSAHKVMFEEKEVSLTLTEFRILTELLRGKGQVLSRDRLREKALGSINVTDRTIDVHMASLRKKLNHLSESIQTVRGVGYRFTETVQ